jgi:hypothetical protein
VTPDRPDLHAAERLPDVLPPPDRVAVEQLLGAGYDLCRDARRLGGDAEAEPAQHCEGGEHDEGKKTPEPLVAGGTLGHNELLLHRAVK